MYNQIFAQSNTETTDIKKHIDACKLYIYNIQSNNKGHGECFLSFYPLAKNIRFLSSYFFVNITKGLKPILSEYPRPGEDGFWKQQTGENSWYPWLWSRNYANNQSTKDSIENLFKPIDRLVDITSFDENYIEDLKKEPVSHIGLYLASLDHVFDLNDSLLNKILNQYINYTLPDKICGLQIRRGEIATPKINNEGSWSGRKIYTLDEYMNHVKNICEKLQTNNIFISTDSSETIDYLKNTYTDYTFYNNNYDQTLFIRYDSSWKQEFLDSPSLELQIAKKPELIEHYTNSCLADLLSLSQCDGYVGGMNMSEYGICGWMLQMAKQKKITPYFNIEGIFEERRMLLL
jgi:hypothetical protein